MLVPGDLGFRLVAVFLFLVVPIISLFLRRKWRIAVARKEEINRLLVMASEEASRAEVEASFGYSPAFVAIPSQRVCAVCYTPTQNRCARCKSVNYCSGKCQIIHWRQGHKNECHTSLASFEDEAENVVGKTVKRPYTDDYSDTIEVNGSNCVEDDNTTAKPGFVDRACSPSEICGKDVDDSAVPLSKGGLAQPEICTTVSSGAHKFGAADGMRSADSISDDDGIHDLNSDSCDSSSTFDNTETVVCDSNVQESKPRVEESFVKVESVGNISPLGGPKEGTVEKISGSSCPTTCHSDKKSVEPSVSSVGFWDGSLDSTRIGNYACYNSQPGFVESDDRKSSDSKSNPQFNFSADFSVDCRSDALEELLDPRVGSLSPDKVVAVSTIADVKPKGATSYRSSTILSPKRSEIKVKEIKINEGLVKSEDVRPVDDTLKYDGLRSYSLEGVNDLIKDSSPSLVPEKTELVPKFPNGSVSSVTKGNTVPSKKSLQTGVSGATAPPVKSSSSSAAVGLKLSMLKAVEQLRTPRLSKQGDGGGKNNDKGVFPYELFVKLYHWNKVELRPCGLINCGNSCYANAVLQCLAITPPLTAYLLQGLHSKGCVKKEWCFTCEFERLILKGKEVGSPLSPIGILSQIQKIGSHLASGREEDAHEFLRYAIDMMQSICLQEARASASSFLEETTLVGLTFGGYLRSKIKCTRCHGKSERQERMMDLTVEIGGDIETLEDALRKFTGTESLDGENKYYCGRCKSYEKAKKRLSISEAPNVLTIALKRFQSGKFGKLNKSIRFPEILDLAPFMRGSNDKSHVYRLYGVVVHLDIMNAAFSGHYVCYVRNAQNMWYKIDDSVVKPVEIERVMNKGAYMLFYSRCSPRAPRSIRNNVISHVKNAQVEPSRTNGINTALRQRNLPENGNHAHGNLANLGYIHPDEAGRIPHILDFDSSSDNTSIFSNSDEVSCSTDSTRESISADDISDYVFGCNGFWRHSSDSDTSSSSSSSSPLYTKYSPVSHLETHRYVSTSLTEPSVLQTGNKHSVSTVVDPFRVHAPHEMCGTRKSGSKAEVPILQSNSSSKQFRKPVNSSCRCAEPSILGWTNPLDNVISGVHLMRRSSRKKPD